MNRLVDNSYEGPCTIFIVKYQTTDQPIAPQGNDCETRKGTKYCIIKQWPNTKIVSEYDQEIIQSQIADKPVASLGRATQQSRDTRKTNKAKQPALSSPST